MSDGSVLAPPSRTRRLVDAIKRRLAVPLAGGEHRHFHIHEGTLPPGRPSAQDYVVFDLETTGLSPTRGDRIVSIGAVRVRGGRVAEDESFETLVNPGRRVPPASTRYHGVTDAMVAHAPPMRVAVRNFHAFAGEHAVLVAHNAAFDLTCLHCVEVESGVGFRNPVLCSLMLSAWLDPGQHDHSLDGLARRGLCTITSRHSAAGDAIDTARLLLNLLGEAERRGVPDLGTLFTRSRMGHRIAQAAAHF